VLAKNITQCKILSTKAKMKATEKVCVNSRKIIKLTLDANLNR